MGKKHCPKCTTSHKIQFLKEEVGYLWIPQEVLHTNLGRDKTKILKLISYICSSCGYVELYKE